MRTEQEVMKDLEKLGYCIEEVKLIYELFDIWGRL